MRTTVPVLWAALCIGCGATPAAPPEVPAPVHVEAAPTPPAAESLPMDPFDLDLYRQVAASAEGDLALSPASVRLALGMTGGGARGDTAAELTRVLRADGGLDSLHAELGTQLAAWGGPEGGGHGILAANRLYAQVGAPFVEQFVALTRDTYRAEIQGADFRADAAGERARINDWVAETTTGRIVDLLPADALDELTRLVLVNALAFEGVWEVPFDPDQTQEAEWRGTGGGRVQLMTAVRTVGYLDQGGLQLVELDYAAGNLSMVVVLPRDPGDLAEAEGLLDAAQLGALLDAVSATEVVLALPRFTARARPLDLVPVLRAMGVETLFDPDRADLSGLSPEPGLAVSGVFHQATVAVDEEGTQAAAASGVVVAKRSLRGPPVFRADHPFIYYIRDRDTGAVLFAGRVSSAPGGGG